MDSSQKELIVTLRNKFLKDYQFKPTHLLPNLPFLRSYGGDLRVKENTSLTLAIDTFLNIIVKSEEPGIFRKFITALKENEYTQAASLLEGPLHSAEPALQELLTAFYPMLVDKIIPSEIMPTLLEKKFLSKTDMQEILAIEKNQGSRIAMIQLLSYTATKSIHWFAKLMYSLKQHEYGHITDEILDNSGAKSLSSLIAEEERIANNYRALSQTKEAGLASQTSNAHMPSVEYQTMEEKTMHFYQSGAENSLKGNMDVNSQLLPAESFRRQRPAPEGMDNQLSIIETARDNKTKGLTNPKTVDWTSSSRIDSVPDTSMKTAKQKEVFSLISNHPSLEDSTDIKKFNYTDSRSQAWSKPVAQVGPQRTAELEREQTVVKEPVNALTRTASRGNAISNNSGAHGLVTNFDMPTSRDPPSGSSLVFNTSPTNNLSANSNISTESSQMVLIQNNLDSNSSHSNLRNSAELNNDENDPEQNEIPHEELILRSYQAELVEDAKQEKNCIISAPTGSGKTIVALEIIREHLETAPIPGERKVVFFVPTVPLVRQQLKQFQRYLRQFKTGHISGGETTLSVSVLSEINDILVMTPQILVDALSRTTDRIESLTQFTLLVFDECHHTTKGHAYNKIMNFYMDEKFNQQSLNLPQIVGLTASVGTDRAQNVQQVISHILQLCANLDCWSVCTVKIHKAEMLKHCKSTEQDIVEVPSRKKDPFKETVSSIMRQIEDIMQDNASKTEIRNFLSAERTLHGTEKYTQWLSKSKKDAHRIYDQRLRRFYISCAEHLTAYNNALLLNADCRSEDALVYLQKEFDKMSNHQATPEEKYLIVKFRSVEESLQNISKDPSNVNPKLLQLKRSILKAYEKNSDMRCILFCKTREMTLALSNWINDEIKILKAHYLTGAHTGSDNSGLTQNKQENVIEQFKNGEYKVIVATSIGEEGLDITKCNVVIRYEYATNETAMIQARGRGRAEDSEYILVTDQSRGIAEREYQNKLRENLMNKALQEISTYSEMILKQQIEKLQADTKKERDRQKQLEEMQQRIHGSRLIPDEISLNCRKCDNFCCFSTDIAKNESHYIIIDRTLQERAILESHPKPIKIRVGGSLGGEFDKKYKLFCSKCHQDWGITVIFRDIKLPVVKIESFIMYDNDSNKLPPVKKWKDVRFRVRDLTDVDIMQLMRQPIFSD